jgi:hypothetical protein
VDSPVLGRITADGPAERPGAGGHGGTTLIEQFFNEIGPLPKADKDPALKASLAENPPPYMPPPYTKTDAVLDIPEMIPGTDSVEHERDILLIVTYAMEHGGVKTPSEMLEWLHRQFGLAARDGMIPEDGGMAPKAPDITYLADYLRGVLGESRAKPSFG